MSQSGQPSTIELRLEAMAYGGDAIGRVAGKPIFISGGIAGETVRAEIVEDRGRFARARVIEVVEASPHRVAPRCPHFGFDAKACGGCHWQHIEHAAQARFKADIVREQFRRLGRIDDAPVCETIAGPSPWAYRNRAQFSVTPDGRWGFQAARSHRVVPIDECHIVEPPIAEWLNERGKEADRRQRVEVRASSEGSTAVRESSRQPPTSNPTPLAYTRPSGGRPVGRQARSGDYSLQLPTSNFHVKDAMFRVSTGSFFQVNTSLIETLVDLAVGRLPLNGVETVVDAYCGVGLFTRFLAPRAGRVIGIEASPGAIADARVNLAQWGNVEWREGQVENELPVIGHPLDAVIVDPPRAGCGPKVIEAIVGKRVKRLAYVSCDPSTLARDARQLLDGGYRLIEVQPIDLFPQTYHIECVARFERAGDARDAQSRYTPA